ncbi:hypothetical protein BU23DRAFT_525229 [Bimuria novae-zelandiae CBS 107.79]|uniref:Zn(2)-C6 fungal-type domain-containing protein n=1 Tax=Bimuria novae-zelandiae CBS 107.79 TaxID=1447943 RepID=A0A6A5VPL8_9PLEO|nr:hypothetical protein BU23DRAFT_525229 [Bimuria novae-zelandiae CBS 107.79]
MPPESANSSPGANYWYGGNLPNGLPTGMSNSLEGLPSEPTNPRVLRRASEAVIPSNAFQRQVPWDGIAPLHIDTSTVLRAQSVSASANHKAPLAPRQGLAGVLGGARNQHQSPISGTYALRTPRGKITSIACESCRKRKSKCDGVRPKCNTCQTKNLSCVYDVAEDGKTTTQLRAHVRRLAKELDDMKSIVSLLALAPDRTSAATWANELEKNGFAHHSAEEIKRALQEAGNQPGQLAEHGSLETPINEQFRRPSLSVAESSYGGSSRDSREQSQPAMVFHTPDHAIDNFPYNESDQYSKFSFECAFYRRTKREMLANGWDEAQIFGRNEVDVDTLLLGFVDPQETLPVPTWAAKMVNKMVPGIPLPARLASTFLLTKMMRWLIWPSVDNMNAMPDWLMPLARQDLAPYDLLIDLIPWPQLRQYLYQHPGEFVAGAFFGLIGINWPYTDDACHYWEVDSACSRLTPLFETHINDLDSWTLDAKALELMPQIEGLVPIAR